MTNVAKEAFLCPIHSNPSAGCTWLAVSKASGREHKSSNLAVEGSNPQGAPLCVVLWNERLERREKHSEARGCRSLYRPDVRLCEKHDRVGDSGAFNARRGASCSRCGSGRDVRFATPFFNHYRFEN